MIFIGLFKLTDIDRVDGISFACGMEGIIWCIIGAISGFRVVLDSLPEAHASPVLICRVVFVALLAFLFTLISFDGRTPYAKETRRIRQMRYV